MAFTVALSHSVGFLPMEAFAPMSIKHLVETFQSWNNRRYRNVSVCIRKYHEMRDAYRKRQMHKAVRSKQINLFKSSYISCISLSCLRVIHCRLVRR